MTVSIPRTKLPNTSASRRGNRPTPPGGAIHTPSGFARRPVRIQMAALRDEAAHYRRRLEAASQIGKTLADCATLPQLYERLSHNVFDLFPRSNYLYVFRNEEDGRGIYFIHAVQNGRLIETGEDSLAPALMLPPSPNGLQSEVVRSRMPLIINDLAGYHKIGRMVTEKASAPEAQSALLAPMLAQRKVVGVLELLSSARQHYNRLDADLLSLVGNTAAMALQNQYLQDELTIARRGLSSTYENTIESYRRALELRDTVTEGHSIRVADLSVRLGTTLGVQPHELVFLRFGAVLHDIGKIGVPDRVLLKPGKLDEDDMQIMHKHPEYALEMLGTLPNFSPVLEIPYYHHEKWDGTGYPHGLEGEDIPLLARIFAVIDVYDALCSERPYRQAWDREEALGYIQEQSGLHFDPRIVTAFLTMLLR